MIPLRDIRRRIQSIRRISHITRAMKTVSAIRLMKVQNQVLRQKPYAGKLRELVNDLVARTPGSDHPMLERAAGLEPQAPTPGSGIVALALGSDRGLCGPYNNNLMHEVARFRAARPGGAVRLVVFGKKLRDLLRARGVSIEREFLGFYHEMTFDRVNALAREYLAGYQAGRLGELWVMYTEFRSTARQKVTAERLLPIGAGTVATEPLFPEYVYEPDPLAVLDQVLPLYFDREVWRTFLEATASEHIARMVAMDMATVNAGDMIRSLTLRYNKARQESITSELSEISTAAEAFRVR
jgi:F-type H+-transporting ATPase subunit gamma